MLFAFFFDSSPSVSDSIRRRTDNCLEDARSLLLKNCYARYFLKKSFSLSKGIAFFPPPSGYGDSFLILYR